MADDVAKGDAARRLAVLVHDEDASNLRGGEQSIQKLANSVMRAQNLVRLPVTEKVPNGRPQQLFLELEKI